MMPKFRAWFNIEEGYGGQEMCEVKGWDEEGEVMLYNSGDYRWDEVILMQYTGLKDKNGVEIYLDDVLSDEYGRKYIVVFKGGCVRRDAIRPGGKNRWISNYLEVIGNIWENPELLEVTE